MKNQKNLLANDKVLLRQLDSKARSAAQRAGLIVKRSRAALSIDNQGGYMIVDPHRNTIEAGEKFELTAEEVIAYCTDT